MRGWARETLAAVAMLASAGANAQPAPPSRAVIPPGPDAMPGDYFDLRQSDQLKVPLGPPAGPNARPRQAPPSSVPSPGLALATVAAQAAEASCAADGYMVTVAVTDAAGNLKAALAPDAARPNSVYMAMRKTLTVIGFKMSTLEFRRRVEKDPSLMAQVKPSMSLLPGGVPILKDGRIVGAIATSGATAYEEEKCANDGIAAIQARLPG